MERRAGVLVTLVLLGSTANVPAGQWRPSVEDLVKETQQTARESDELVFVWWLPPELWRAMIETSRVISREAAEKTLSALRPYTIVAALAAEMDAPGHLTYGSEAELRAAIRIADSQAVPYRPLRGDEISQEAKTVLSRMRPAMAHLYGQMGQNMHFYFFPGKTAKGRRIAAPSRGGSFSVLLQERVFKWRLPLASLFPKKTCPKCKARLKGTYKFCPWDGTRLPRHRP